eukprot:10562792-Alexandrium_andersonii.AAC.1
MPRTHAPRELRGTFLRPSLGQRSSSSEHLKRCCASGRTECGFLTRLFHPALKNSLAEAEKGPKLRNQCKSATPS